MYILENNSDANIPDATWDGDVYSGDLPSLSRSLIRITGSIGKLTHSAQFPSYKNIVIDLPDQIIDASLNLPDKTFIGGNLSIVNTNNRTLTLLASSSPTSSVTVAMGAPSVPVYDVGLLGINQNAKVALATATSAAPSTSYRLQIENFIQSGGNFSLQDYDNPSGSSTLSIKGALVQTDGTFITNSSTTNPDVKFVVEMTGPSSYGTRYGIIYRTQSIQMSGKTIDNGSHLITLRIAQNLTRYSYSYSEYGYGVGVVLGAPLTVGRLELLKGTLNTTGANIITVADPSPSAVTVGTSDSSYVNGPMRRWTNSSNTYVFPVGKGIIFTGVHLDSCAIIPSTANPSLYQAEYFDSSYLDLNVESPLKAVLKSKYWDISKISGSEARVQLFRIRWFLALPTLIGLLPHII